MKGQPLTSVVIPAYNAELFLERTLRSALGQTYRNLEVIVIDDGSTDRTRAIAEAVAITDDRVRIISVPNGGVAKARNIGIAEARGEFVAFLDADDLWHPAKIELQFEAMSHRTGDGEPAAVYAWSRTIDIEDRVTGSGNRVVLKGYCFARHLYAKPVGNGSSILVRREAAIAAGGFDPTWAARGIGGCEDLDFELKIAAKYPITAVGLYLVGYRQYPGNMSSNSLAMALGAISTVARHIELCPELPDWAVRAASAAISEYAMAKLLGAGHRKLVLRELSHLFRTDFARGLRFATPLLIGKLGSLILSAVPVREADPPERLFFYDLSPDFVGGSSGNGLQSRDRKMLGRLDAVDAVLAKSMANGFDNCTR
ncbi:MAG: glycosyl transferase [Acidobacteria bacterium]|nr:MAG: glycosyl transferase [Acidobacteriota bacterium]